MKNTFYVIILILTIFSVNKVYGEINMVSGKKPELTFMIMVSTPDEEMKAKILIKSIRDFGKEYSAAPIIVVLSDTNATRGESLEEDVTSLVGLKAGPLNLKFPFADKVYACAQIEEMVMNATEWLVWLNPDALIVGSPSEICAGKDFWASLRPVHHQNIGSGWDEPVSDYWNKIYDITGVDEKKVWETVSFVDNKSIRAYFNSGCMAFRPGKGILREWRKVFDELLLDKANYDYYSADPHGAIFLHQAVLSAVLIAKAGREKINILPPSYGYPLVLQNTEPFLRKINSINEMKIILCGDYRYLKTLAADEPHKKWITNNIY